MGEVWEAIDTKLNRQVALKILPEAFAADPDRLAGFSGKRKFWPVSTIPVSQPSTGRRSR